MQFSGIKRDYGHGKDGLRQANYRCSKVAGPPIDVLENFSQANISEEECLQKCRDYSLTKKDIYCCEYSLNFNDCTIRGSDIDI